MATDLEEPPPAEGAALQQAGQYAGTRDVLTPANAPDYGLDPTRGFIVPPLAPFKRPDTDKIVEQPSEQPPEEAKPQAKSTADIPFKRPETDRIVGQPPEEAKPAAEAPFQRPDTDRVVEQPPSPGPTAQPSPEATVTPSYPTIAEDQEDAKYLTIRQQIAQGQSPGAAQATTEGKQPQTIAEQPLAPAQEDDQTIIKKIDSHLGGALQGQGATYVAMGKKYGVDPRLLAAISMFETGNGTSHLVRTRNNVGGITGPGHSGAGGDYMPYGSIEEGIEAEARLIKRGYINQGLDTIEKIGNKWAPPGAFNDPQGTNREWPVNVGRFYTALGGTGKLGEAGPVVSAGEPQPSRGGGKGAGDWSVALRLPSTGAEQAAPAPAQAPQRAQGGGEPEGGGGGQTPAALELSAQAGGPLWYGAGQEPQAQPVPQPQSARAELPEEMQPANVLGVQTVTAPSAPGLPAPVSAPGLPGPGSNLPTIGGQGMPAQGMPSIALLALAQGMKPANVLGVRTVSQGAPPPAPGPPAPGRAPGALALPAPGRVAPAAPGPAPRAPTPAAPAPTKPAPAPTPARPVAPQRPGAPAPAGGPTVGGIRLEGGPRGSTIGVPNPPGAEAIAQLPKVADRLKAHAALISPDDPRVKKQEDNYVKGEHFVPGDVMHEELLGGLPGGHGGRQRQLLGEGERAIAERRPMHISYISAPKEALKFPTRESRQVQYDKHSPEARLLGKESEGIGQLVGHSMIPVAVGITPSKKEGEPHQGVIHGISTNTIANNVHHVNTVLKEMGRESPYPRLSPKLFTDLEGYVSNLNAGHKGTGEGYALGTREYPNEPDRGHIPYRLTRGEADYLNLIINNTMAFPKHARGQALRELARVNGTLITPEGETNPLRFDIENHRPGWAIERAGKRPVLEPSIKSFNAGLIHEVHAHPHEMRESIRPGREYQQLTESLARTSPRGRPDVPMAVGLETGGFVPPPVPQFVFSPVFGGLPHLQEGGPVEGPAKPEIPPLSDEEYQELSGNIRKQFLSGKLKRAEYLERMKDVPGSGEPIHMQEGGEVEHHGLETESGNMRPLGYRAAVKLPDGQIFSGSTHEHAYHAAEQPRKAEYGFIHRKSGRFVSYDEADEILDKAFKGGYKGPGYQQGGEVEEQAQGNGDGDGGPQDTDPSAQFGTIPAEEQPGQPPAPMPQAPPAPVAPPKPKPVKAPATPLPVAQGEPIAKPSDWKAAPEHHRQAYLEQKVANTLANQYRGKETHELEVQRKEDGGVKYDPQGNPIYVKHDYDIVNSPLLKKKGLNQIANADKHPDTLDIRENKKGEFEGADKMHAHLNPTERRRLSAMRTASAVETMGDRIAESFHSMKDIPEIMAGQGWYSRMRKKLRKALGKEHHEMFAQLLGATSAKTPVRNNFIQALDALEQFKEGKFDNHIKKYLEAYNVLKDQGKGSLGRYMQSQGIQLVDKDGNPVDAHKTDGESMSQWIAHHGILPLQKNGSKYNANSEAVLKVLAGTWLKEVDAPKTPNFAGNLTGRTLEATIDVWAARHLQRLGYEGLTKGKPWRAQAASEPGVNALDFAFSQDAMRHAADKISRETGKKMNPDDLQAILWFAEKHHYENKGWTRGQGAEKGSFDDVADLAFPKTGEPMTSAELRAHYAALQEAAAQRKARIKTAKGQLAREDWKRLGPYVMEHELTPEEVYGAEKEGEEEEPEGYEEGGLVEGYQEGGPVGSKKAYRGGGFDPNRMGEGISWFAGDWEPAEYYAARSAEESGESPNVGSYGLSINNPFDASQPLTKPFLARFRKAWNEDRKERGVKELGKEWEERVMKDYKAGLARNQELGLDDSIFNSRGVITGGRDAILRRVLKRMGHDAISFHGPDPIKHPVSGQSYRKPYQQYGVFDPEQVQGYQRGGRVAPPAPGPTDTVPAMLTPGEFVVNRNAVQAIGPQKLEALNQAVPDHPGRGYQQGGPIDTLARLGDEPLVNQAINYLPPPPQTGYGSVPPPPPAPVEPLNPPPGPQLVSQPLNPPQPQPQPQTGQFLNPVTGGWQTGSQFLNPATGSMENLQPGMPSLTAPPAPARRAQPAHVPYLGDEPYIQSMGLGGNYVSPNLSGLATNFGHDINGKPDQYMLGKLGQGSRIGAFGQDVTNPHLAGASLPLATIQKYIGDYTQKGAVGRRILNDIRSGRYLVEVTAPNGIVQQFPLVDEGPGPHERGKIDLTGTAYNQLGVKDDFDANFRIVDTQAAGD